MGPCAKRRVLCEIVSVSGAHYLGTNDCDSPQPECPRAPGEDYTKCKTICRQEGHAEVVALARAGPDAVGAHAFVYGHEYCCRGCQKALYGAGVLWVSVVQITDA